MAYGAVQANGLNNAINQGSAQGYNAGLGAPLTTAAPRTISSAIARMDALNERLVSAVGQLIVLSDQIGGPRNPAEEIKAQSVPGASAVGRLNDTADCAHGYLLEIENLLASISRALG